MEKEYTELEKVFKLTIERQGKRISDLITNLDLAHSQIEVMKAEQSKVVEGKESAE
ncbi:hypothetical protein [Sporosarcina jiandibaonis]|uniref:hypothetical protein n=1 Tax=Sporosarcina jiandibaonis TaxID=2715535 RepID=UPI001551FD90|nr:hypothetical protein [Sporosarcina jiandibaonis]